MTMPTQKKNNWIFIRGLVREQMHWDGFVEKFSSTFGANVRCIDLPGAGIYFNETSPSTISQIVDHVQGHAGDIDGKPMIMAHSMGCVVALEWIRRLPDSFSGAIFTNTSVRGICPMFERIRLSALPTFVKIALTHHSLSTREASKFPLICANVKKREHSIKLWIEIQKKHPVSMLTSLNQLRAAKAYRVDTPPSSIPILFLSSLGDRLVNPSCSERISKAWGQPLRVHSWGGHDLFHDDSDWVIDQTRDWLAKLS